jgi:multidrug resistance efflux pump
MDGLSVAASIFAVVDVSVKVITLCSQYSKAVAHAEADISHLETQVKGLKTTLGNAKALIEAPQCASLSTSRDLKDQLAGCRIMLEDLLGKLESVARKTKHRPWLRALKWPFSREETNATISALERYHRLIMDGLQIDQT